MTCASIRNLAPELIYLILSCLDHPKDLYAAIQASPYIFGRVFRGSDDVILSNVLKNTILSPVLPDALVSIYSRTVKRNSCCRLDSPHLCARDLSRAIRMKREWEEIPRSMPDPRPLASLHLSIDHFIKDCSKVFLSIAMGEVERAARSTLVDGRSVKPAKKMDDLSFIELARFQRAFYRYNTIQNLIKGPPCRDRGENLSMDQIEDILSEFTPWEVEEVACVHQYILSRLCALFTQMEDHFICLVLSAEEKATSKYLPWGDEGELGLESSQAEAPFDEEGDFIYLESEKGHIDDLLEHLASLGLPFLRELFEADYHRRKELIVGNNAYKVRGLEDILSTRAMPSKNPIFQGEFRGRREKFLTFEGDEIWKRNHAWLWAHQYHPQHDYFLPANSDLRDWGYVFWDDDTLKTLDVMKDPRSIGSCDQFPEHYKDPAKELCNQPSAQKRLRDLGYA